MADVDTADCEIGRVHVADSHNHLAGKYDLWAPNDQQDQEGENYAVDYNRRKQATALPTKKINDGSRIRNLMSTSFESINNTKLCIKPPER